MAILIFPDGAPALREPEAIRAFLAKYGILYQQWTASVVFEPSATPDEILAAYDHALTPYMQAHGYQTADVITVHADTPDLPALSAKFLQEHTHSEDEVRFFVDGQGDFWFHLEETALDAAVLPDAAPLVFCVRCVSGDLLSVPAGYKHWFDMGAMPFVKAIRIFIDKSGWVPQYTGSPIATQYAAALL